MKTLPVLILILGTKVQIGTLFWNKIFLLTKVRSRGKCIVPFVIATLTRHYKDTSLIRFVTPAPRNGFVLSRLVH